MKKVISLILVIAVIFTLGSGISIFADFDFLVTDGEYTYYVDQGSTANINLHVYPYIAQGYETEDAAVENWTWSLVNGSTNGVSVVNSSIEAYAHENLYWTSVTISVSNTAAPGAAALTFTDGGGLTTTIVVVINPVNGSTEYVSNVKCYYYDARTATEIQKAAVTGISVQWNTHYSETKYASAIDSTLKSFWDSSIITNLVITPQSSTSPYILDSVNFNNATETLKNGYSYYVSEDHQDNVEDYYMGWQYRVYRYNGTEYAMVPISEYIGANQFGIQNGDVIVWKFGSFMNVTFPATWSVQ